MRARQPSVSRKIPPPVNQNSLYNDDDRQPCNCQRICLRSPFEVREILQRPVSAKKQAKHFLLFRCSSAFFCKESFRTCSVGDFFFLRFRLGRARALPASALFRPCPSPKTNLNNASRHDANPRSPLPSDTRAAILYTSRCCHRRAESSQGRKETLFSTKPLLRSPRKPVSFF